MGNNNGKVLDTSSGLWIDNEENQSGNNVEGKTTHSPKIPPVVLAQLEGMDNAALIALIRRCCPDKARVLLMGEVEQAQAMLDALAVMALTGDDDKSILNAIREWLDRKQGKPLQKQDIKLTTRSVHLHIGMIPESLDVVSQANTQTTIIDNQ